MKVLRQISGLSILIACTVGVPAFAQEVDLAAEKLCPLYLTKVSTVQVRGKSVPVQVLPEELYSKHDLSFVPNQVRPNETSIDLSGLRHDGEAQVLLGVQSPLHYYLIVDHVRYDAGIFAPSIATQAAGAETVAHGTVIAIRNLSRKRIELLKQELLKPEDELSLSCAQASLFKLRKVGVHLNDHEGVAYKADDVMERVLANGFVDEEGHALQVDVYQSGTQTLEAKLEEMKQATERTERMIRFNFRSFTLEDLRARVGHPFYPEAEEYLRTILLPSH